MMISFFKKLFSRTKVNEESYLDLADFPAAPPRQRYVPEKITSTTKSRVSKQRSPATIRRQSPSSSSSYDSSPSYSSSYYDSGSSSSSYDSGSSCSSDSGSSSSGGCD